MLGSGVQVQYRHGLACFSFKLVQLSSNFFNLGTNKRSGLFSFMKHFLACGDFLQKLYTICLMARRRLVPGISTLWIVFFSKKCSSPRLPQSPSGFCGFVCNFISFTRCCIDDFDWMRFCRHINITNWLIYFNMLIYTKSHVVAPVSLFTVGTVNRVILRLLAFLGLTNFLGFCISLKHGLHEGHLLVALKFLVGLLSKRGLTCSCAEGLTILVIATAVTIIVCLVGTAMWALQRWQNFSLCAFIGTGSLKPHDTFS
jgi:hypothetical protein